MQYFGFDRPSFGIKTLGFGVSNSKLSANFTTGEYKAGGEVKTFTEVFDFNRAGKAWLVKDTGLVEYAIDTPRFDNGLLIEQSATNSIYPSSNLTNEIWSLQGSATVNEGTGDNHIYSKLSNGGNSSNAVVYRSSSVRAGDVMSQYVRGVSGATASLFTHYLDAKTVVLQNTWVRAFARYNASSAYPSIYYAADFRLGTATQLGVFGIQVEKGLLPTSLIPTTTTPVTRPADYLLNKITGTTITGDWDSTLTLSIVAGNLVHSGYGRIRSLEIN